MPQLLGQLAYCITVAFGHTCEISQFEYVELVDARKIFDVFCRDADVICATLSGPNDETIADYDNSKGIR